LILYYSIEELDIVNSKATGTCQCHSTRQASINARTLIRYQILNSQASCPINEGWKLPYHIRK